MAANSRLQTLGEHVDRLITHDPRCREFILPMYEAARQTQGDQPLALLAAQRLFEAIDPSRKDVVLLVSGFVSPTLLRGEQDGPVGSAWLGRGLAQAFNVRPVLVTEDSQIPEVRATCRAAGLNVYDLEEGLHVGEVEESQLEQPGSRSTKPRLQRLLSNCSIALGSCGYRRRASIGK
jgi:hypothetical protein